MPSSSPIQANGPLQTAQHHTGRRSSRLSGTGALSKVVVAAFVFAALFHGREILVPLAMAMLIAFLLTPVVVFMERRTGRVAGVVVAVLMLLSVVVGVGWVLTGQISNLMEKLPDYQGNIRAKLRAMKIPEHGNFSRLRGMFTELKEELPGNNEAPHDLPQPSAAPNGNGGAKAVPVQIVENKAPAAMQTVTSAVSLVMSPLGTAALVLLLTICILLQREDLRGRLTRLVGGGNISATRRAMDDAGRRVARYLQMQLVVNLSYGTLVAAALYFIGVPNVLVWGVLSALLRFIPYVGAWVAAACPTVLSLAASQGWNMAVFTIVMFVAVELLFANLVEPWLYGAHTGVSSLALILAAVFWTWMWGAAGLVLSTPLTVCLVVVGRHVPALGMLSVLLSDEQPLPPHQEFYHRLLSPGESDGGEFAESFISGNSRAEFFDSVFVPALVAIERDFQSGELDATEHGELLESLGDVTAEIKSWPEKKHPGSSQPDSGSTVGSPATCRVLFVPARAIRDGVASEMLAELFKLQNYTAECLSAQLTTGELVEKVIQDDARVLCISAVAPTTVIQARYLCRKVRESCPGLRIIAGLWGAVDGVAEAGTRLRDSGADAVATTFAETSALIAKYASSFELENAALAPSPDETSRLAELDHLHLANPNGEPAFDRMTKKLAHILNVPMALVSVLDAEQQFFKSQRGLPKDVAAAGSAPRHLSICDQVVKTNKLLVVEDLARDPRFSQNPFVRDLHLRFYAGVPLRTAAGNAIGTICVLDYKPRQFGEHERRLIEVTAEEVMEAVKDACG